MRCVRRLYRVSLRHTCVALRRASLLFFPWRSKRRKPLNINGLKPSPPLAEDGASDARSTQVRRKCAPKRAEETACRKTPFATLLRRRIISSPSAASCLTGRSGSSAEREPSRGHGRAWRRSTRRGGSWAQRSSATSLLLFPLAQKVHPPTQKPLAMPLPPCYKVPNGRLEQCNAQEQAP